MHSLDIEDFIKELSLGRATVKFMLERFTIPKEEMDGHLGYGPRALTALIRIKDLMDQGLMPSQIEAAMESRETSVAPLAGENPGNDVRLSKDALSFIQNLFEDIKVHQSRIARAHEKRAEAEERKAVAIEKRAEAEEKKALAMNNIAAALQEMSRHRSADNQTMEIAGQAARALTMTETGDIFPLEPPAQAIEPESPDDPVDLGDGLDARDLEDLFDHPEVDAAPEEDYDLDDLDSADLDISDFSMDEEDIEAGPEDFETAPPASDAGLEDLLDQSHPLPDTDNLDLTGQTGERLGMDDLSLLVDEAPSAFPSDLDDLSALVDETFGSALDDLSLLVDYPAPENRDMDDLSLLVDEPPASASEDLDDLSALVNEGPGDLDDLSLLVDSPAQADLDDLSALVDEPAPAASGGGMDDLSLLVAEPAADLDDLSALVSADEAPEPVAEPSLRPDISPAQDLEKYKAAVMKIIIDLKNQGLTPAQTTERLNRDQVPTLSGKPQWREKAIEKIYGFIVSAQ